jgi:tetratricopeptide (TPR) repeat protein
VHHALAAGDDGAVLEYGRLAGATAARNGAHREAVAHLRAAAALADRLPEVERAELLESYATEALLAGRHEEGLAAARTAKALRLQLGEAAKISEDFRLISRLAWWTGDAEQSREAASRAVAVLETGAPDRPLALAYGNLAHRYVHTYELDDAISWGERAQELAERLGDDATAIHAATIVNAARLCQADPDAAAALEQAYEQAVARGLFDHAHRALGNLASIVSDDLARYDAAVPLIERALAFAEQHDLDAGYAWLLGQRAKLRLERGDWVGALADADNALARSGPRGVNAVLPFTVRGRIQAARGEPDALNSLDEAARQAHRVNDAQWLAPVADGRSEYFLWHDDPERAQEEARQGIAAAGGSDGPPFVVGRLAYRLWKAGGSDELPKAVAEPFRMMIDGAWAEAAAEWARRGGRCLQAEALAAGDEGAAAEAL